MKQNQQDRFKEYFKHRSLKPNEEGYEKMLQISKQRLENDEKYRKKIEGMYEKAIGIVVTQMENGIQLSQDNELRYFLNEYNTRLWDFGFGSLPGSFNILENFFKWRSDLFFFELLEEEEHLFSFYDFIDFVTSGNCSNSFDYLIDRIEDELIYSYNILNNVKDISFKTSDSKEYLISGVSFVKRGNEIALLLIAGELANTDEISKDLPDIDQMISQSRSYIRPADDRKKEAVKLLGKSDIWKVNMYARIDIETKTITSRYVQKDVGQAFTTISDDFGMLEHFLRKQGITDINEFIANQAEEISKYEAIFEAAFNCLYLPEYFDFYNDYIDYEEHPTGLANKKLRRHKLKKNDLNYDSAFFIKQREVCVLDRNIDPTTGVLVLRNTELKIERDGYWQYLEHDKIGKDRNGKPMHGRTWVEQTLAWTESETLNSKDVQVNISPNASVNAGFIYMLRNSAHALDIFKIGLTTKTVEERAKQLSGTPSPDQFLIIHRWKVSDCVLVEKLIHEALDDYRVNDRREFFKLSIEKAIETISPIVQVYFSE